MLHIQRILYLIRITFLALSLKMWSIEIEQNLKHDVYFMGCYSPDLLPSFPNSFPRTLIINTMPSNMEGEHWVALVLKKKRCYYFDSFGLSIMNRNILRFLERYRKVTYSDVCIQSVNSEKCGKFCIAFVKSVRCKQSFSNFLSSFDYVNLANNDILIEKIYL